MSDLTFQRHVLVQALIVIDFLLSLTPKAKKKLEELKAQKSLIYNHTLSEADTKWAIDTRANIALYLQDGPDGKFYYRMADTVLSRDKNWVRWKVESCPPISKQAVLTSDQMGAISGAKRAYANRRIKTNPMGAVDISFVSDTMNANGLDTLRHAEAVKVPDVEKCVMDVEQIDLELEMATDEEKTYLQDGRTTAVWRALRVAGRRMFSALDKVDEGTGLKNLLADDGGAGFGGVKKEGGKDAENTGDVKVSVNEGEGDEKEDKIMQDEKTADTVLEDTKGDSKMAENGDKEDASKEEFGPEKTGMDVAIEDSESRPVTNESPATATDTAPT